ncbi:MAG: GatB/YqeY domain-containing protein [Gammaproteobacteria bacterium]
MTLKQRIQEDMKTAMRAGDKPRLGIIRLILAAVKQIEVDERIEVDDIRLLGTLSKMVKQRQDSIAQFAAANRQDLVAQEEFEINVIQTYLPQPLSEEELDGLLQQAIEATHATSIQDMGKVMNWLKPHVQGRADMGLVSAKIKQKLA